MIIGENPVLFNDYKQFNDYRKQLNFFDFMKQKNRNTSIPQSFPGSLILCGFQGGVLSFFLKVFSYALGRNVES